MATKLEFPFNRYNKREDENMNTHPKSHPFDNDSLRILRKLPGRSTICTGLLVLMKFLSYPFIFLGTIGLAMTLYEGGSQATADYSRSWIYSILFAVGILGFGGFLRIISEIYTFEKAPLGYLFQFTFEDVSWEKKRKIYRSICKQTEDQVSRTTQSIFARAIALDMIAETASSNEEAVEYANKAIQEFQYLKTQDVKTPLLYFGLATCQRIVKNNKEAIDSYETYLQMRPDDTETKLILEELLRKEDEQQINSQHWKSTVDNQFWKDFVDKKKDQ